MTEDSNLRAPPVKGKTRHHKQPVETYIIIIQYFADLCTALCTENSSDYVTHTPVCITTRQPCAQSRVIQWITAAFITLLFSPQSVIHLFTGLRGTSTQVYECYKFLIFSTLISFSTEKRLCNNSNNRSLKEFRKDLLILLFGPAPEISTHSVHPQSPIPL